MEVGKKIWQFPWKIGESMLIGSGITLAGFLTEYFSSYRISAPSFPFNLILTGGVIVLLILLHLLFRKSMFIRWMSGTGAAISAITWFTGLSVMMGLIPQTGGVGSTFDKLGLTHITSSWTFAFLLIYFLIVLGLTTLKRLTPFGLKNTGFFLNHAGLWVIVAAAAMGTGDIRYYSMWVSENSSVPEWRVTDEKGDTADIRIAIRLHDFDIDEFNAKIVMIDPLKKEIIGNPLLPDTSGHKMMMNGYELEIGEFYRSAINFSGNFREVDHYGSVQAAYIKASKDGKLIAEGWINNGNFMNQAGVLQLDGSRAITLAQPEPGMFWSDVTVYTGDEKTINSRIEVNKPLSVNGWKIYQASYNEEYGRWSPESRFELVKDPWLPAVYTGIFMLMAGVLILIRRGEKLKH